MNLHQISSRRRFLKGLSASSLLALAPRASADQEIIPSLRQLAGGHPLIGAAVPTDFETRLTAKEIGVLTNHFDCVTPENCMKWHNLCPHENDYRFEPADHLIEFATRYKKKFVGHTLIFNREGDYPDWLFRDGGKEANAKLVWKRIEAHVEKLMSRYQGRIDSWDVLNEFVEAPEPGYRVTDFTRVLGPDYPVRLFKIAGQIDPKAKLTYNDFSVESPERMKVILAFVRSLRDKGCRVDVVGSQSHLEIDGNSEKQIDAMIKHFAADGFLCALTELDVDVVSRRHHWSSRTRDNASLQNPYANGCPVEILEKQAEVYRDVFATVMANRKHVDRVTFWGITDRNSWLNKWPWERVNHGLLFDRESEPKPAFHAVSKVLAG
jgi:endo-1,4-beta-xylanase